MPDRKPEFLAEFGLKDEKSMQDITNNVAGPANRRATPPAEDEDLMFAFKAAANRVTSSGPRDDSIHKGGITTYARVFANEIAEPYMKSENLRFPVGSMIVRERLGHAGDQNPELLAVMIKRERGFKPFNHDWEFVVIDKGLSRVKRGDDTQSCMTCHANARASDLVFKTYLKAQ